MNLPQHSKFVFFALLGMFVTACGNDRTHDSSSPISSKEELSTNQDNHSLTSAIDVNTNENQFANTESPSTVNIQNKEQNILSSTIDSKELIAGLGFSEAETSADLSKKLDYYCLSEDQPLFNTDKSSIEEECTKISNRLASVSMESCLNAGLQRTGCHSVKKFPIMVRDFSPIESRLPQGRILVIGGTHADELTSVSIVFKWLEVLNKHHSGLFHWHVAPLMNPDGLFRKDAQRTNHNGVDLNRNMPSDDWHDTALHYWASKSDKSPRKFPGKKPASEPETQWLIDEINHFKPDAIISVHAPYGIVDFDSLALKTAPKSLGKLHLNFLGTYPGSLGNYAGINLNIPVITVELPHAWVMPSETETIQIWEDIVAWLKDNVNTDEAATAQAENNDSFDSSIELN